MRLCMMPISTSFICYEIIKKNFFNQNDNNKNESAVNSD